MISVIQNLEDLSDECCSMMHSLCKFKKESEGVALENQNKELIDERVRKACGIKREAYDSVHMDILTCRIADQAEMESFTGKAIAAIERGEPVLELLTHPRQWNSPVWVNLKEEIVRVFKQMYMGL